MFKKGHRRWAKQVMNVLQVFEEQKTLECNQDREIALSCLALLISRNPDHFENLKILTLEVGTWFQSLTKICTEKYIL